MKKLLSILILSIVLVAPVYPWEAPKEQRLSGLNYRPPVIQDPFPQQQQERQHRRDEQQRQWKEHQRQQDHEYQQRLNRIRQEQILRNQQQMLDQMRWEQMNRQVGIEPVPLY